MKVYLAQVLCGLRRHAIIGYAIEIKNEDELPELKEQVELLKTGLIAERNLINPWCGICGAPASGWISEVGATKFETLAEARPALQEAARQQQETRAFLDAQKRKAVLN